MPSADPAAGELDGANVGSGGRGIKAVGLAVGARVGSDCTAGSRAAHDARTSTAGNITIEGACVLAACGHFHAMIESKSCCLQLAHSVLRDRLSRDSGSVPTLHA